MATAKKYIVKRDSFFHDGEEFTHGDTVTMHAGRAEQHVAVGALEEAPADAGAAVDEADTDADTDAEVKATAKAASAKATSKGKK